MSSIDSADPDEHDAVDAAEFDPDLRAARRTLAFFAIAVGAVVAGFVLVLLGSRGDDGGSTVTGDLDERSGASTSVARIGPTPGQNVDRYLQARAAALVEVEGTQVAVVSLTGYSSVETVDDLVEGLDLDRYLIALVGDEPRQTRSVDDAVADVVDDAEAQLAELEQLAPTVEDDPDYTTFYADEIDRYGRLLASVDDGEVVYGMVVVGRASDLRALASRASVRIVDVGGSGELDRDAPVRGLRPEETATVGEPAFRP